MFIIKYRNFFFILSGLLMIVSLISLWYFRPGFSIEFTGGSLLELQYGEEVPSLQEIQELLSGEELKGIDAFRGLVIQETGQGRFLLRFGDIDEETHQKILSSLQGAQELRFETIGPVIGQELQRKTLWALVAAVGGMFLYVGMAFRKVSQRIRSWRMSLMAIFALAHDILIMAGGFVILSQYYGFEVGILFVTALFTIWGYSINDTIVVFDRVRENLLKEGKKSLEEILAMSINETISRSINTSLAVLILLLFLAIIGPSTLFPFLMPLIIGVIVGTYSSIFIATPLLSLRS